MIPDRGGSQVLNGRRQRLPEDAWLDSDPAISERHMLGGTQSNPRESYPGCRHRALTSNSESLRYLPLTCHTALPWGSGETDLQHIIYQQMNVTAGPCASGGREEG